MARWGGCLLGPREGRVVRAGGRFGESPHRRTSCGVVNAATSYSATRKRSMGGRFAAATAVNTRIRLLADRSGSSTAEYCCSPLRLLEDRVFAHSPRGGATTPSRNLADPLSRWLFHAT